MRTPFLLAVMGATTTGKTEFAEALADTYDATLINADAFQVYRGMDIGTAKPENRHRYELLDIKDPDEGYGVGEWIHDVIPILQTAYDNNRNVILVGGTGLYIRALYGGYADMAGAPDPDLRADLERREAAEGLPALFEELKKRSPEIGAKIDGQNPARVRRALEKLLSPAQPVEFQVSPFKKYKIALDLPKEEVEDRIAARIARMVHNGWVRELEGLRDAGYRPEQPGFRAIGYRNFWQAMVGEMDEATAIARTIVETRRYAKRQRTWLRSEPELDVIGLDPRAGEPLRDALGRMRSKIDSEV
jgi:tRNA dimethylallyltransferase